VDVDPATSEHVDGEQIIKLGVRSLIEDIQNGRGEGDFIRKAVTELSVKHDVLSKFTAFIAIGSGGEALGASMVARRVTRRNPTPPAPRPAPRPAIFSFTQSSTPSGGINRLF